MIPPAEKETVNKILGNRALNNRNRRSRRRGSLKWRGLEMAIIKRTRSRRASSKSLSFEEITADLNRLKAEMTERKPQRGSSEKEIMRVIDRKSLADLQREKRGLTALRGRIRSVAEHHNKVLNAVNEVAMMLLNEELNPLPATGLLDHRTQEQIEKEPVFSGRLKI